MASLSGSLSSLFLSKSQPFHSRNPNPNPSFCFHQSLPSLKLSAKFPQQKNRTDSRRDSSLSEKKSFAVVTGEVFLGLASLFFKREKSKKSSDSSLPVGTLDGREKSGSDAYFRSGQDRNGSVVEDWIDPGVIWEQRPKDVEAERDRKKVTSPGFSFSAAGLLFPYHLGVAQLLLEKGYIKETTPLAGSSAGAIVCVVIASGKSMQEGLQATKILAENCRRKGTAFRLGAVLRDVLEKFLPDDVHVRSNGRVRGEPTCLQILVMKGLASISKSLAGLEI